MSRKQRHLTPVTTDLRSQTSSVPVPSAKELYVWRPDRARDQIPIYPHETWLRYQAASFLGRPATLAEAQELFSRIDVNTRQPIQPAPPRRWWHRLLEL